MALKTLPKYSFSAQTHGYTVMRDDVPLQTPRTLSVTVPTQALAEAIVAECVGQGDKLNLRKMPMTQMSLTAIDIATHHRAEVIDGIMRHGETELICQRADAPPELVAQQDKTWRPFLEWCAETFEAELLTGSGVVPFVQDPSALGALKNYVNGLDAFQLTGVSEAVGTCGSLVLGLALYIGFANVETILSSAELDALWQKEKWGGDPVVDGRQTEIRRDLNDCKMWFQLIEAA